MQKDRECLVFRERIANTKGFSGTCLSLLFHQCTSAGGLAVWFAWPNLNRRQNYKWPLDHSDLAFMLFFFNIFQSFAMFTQKICSHPSRELVREKNKNKPTNKTQTFLLSHLLPPPSCWPLPIEAPFILYYRAEQVGYFWNIHVHTKYHSVSWL